MSTTVDESFVRHFQAEVHLQYQQMGSKLRNTVRTKDNIVGASTTFRRWARARRAPRRGTARCP